MLAQLSPDVSAAAARVVTIMPQLDPAQSPGGPALWLGLALAAGLLGAVVWLLRRRQAS